MPEEKFMKLAIEEAEKGDFPFGAVIIKDNKVITAAHNTANRLDPTAHAEVNAIRETCKKLNTKNLEGYTLYSSCEPCPMCFIAAWFANISEIVYGAEEEDGPENKWKIRVKCSYLNEKSGNKIKVIGGFLREECKTLLREL